MKRKITVVLLILFALAYLFMLEHIGFFDTAKPNNQISIEELKKEKLELEIIILKRQIKGGE